MKRFEKNAIDAILFVCVVEITRLKYPEYPIWYTLIFGLIFIGVVYVMMYLLDKGK